tara:strand:- start:440 stop:634 length:195 start_codon:yes stop_codon:yes gene_type:complete
MKKRSKIKKILNRKTDKTPLNVSTMQGDDKPNNDTNLIQIGGQVGMPEEKKITFKEFIEKSQNF